MADFNWFVDNYQFLFNKYGHKFLAIKNKQVIGVFNSFMDAINGTDEELGTYIVQECNGNASAYTNYISSWNFA